MSLFLNDSFPPIKNDQFLFILKKFKSPIWIYHSDTIIEKIKNYRFLIQFVLLKRRVQISIF
ncbi:Diaminopimelate decarboxylase (part 1) [Candidatus Hamiltonella defensa (Bemisia tabaci)]|nr:Diaminopimelate decarboxylase (part 1) [Candidatus Hamiltonella defensa (Bemisia tabaci)]